MKWNSEKMDWFISTGYIRSFSRPDIENLIIIKDTMLSSLEGFEKINLEPAQIEKKRLRPEELELTEFKSFIENLEANGQDTIKRKSRLLFYTLLPFC